MNKHFTIPEGSRVRVKIDAPMEGAQVRGKTGVLSKPFGIGQFAHLKLDEPIDNFRFWLVHPESLEIVL